MTKIIRTSANINGFYNKDRFLISIFLLLGIGLLIGSVAAGSSAADEKSILYQINAHYTQSKSQHSLLQLFGERFISAFTYMLICYVSGLCAIGTPILFLVPIIYGIGEGIILGFIYANNGFNGVLNGVIFHSLQETCLLLLLIVALKKSKKMSRQTLNALSPNYSDNNAITFKKYNQFYIVIIIITAIICILDALMFKVNIFI